MHLFTSMLIRAAMPPKSSRIFASRLCPDFPFALHLYWKYFGVTRRRSFRRPAMSAIQNPKSKIQNLILSVVIAFTGACLAEEAQLPADVPALPADMQARMTTLQLM